ncbi:hypothetical protein B0T14DRAFT_494157 [Immersiella caudata]|uniref:Uncharacterized protein n=1 Tax=Immersiella caudata TaxID=314043 RepID=A0AA39WVQ8_9PEZI|nr:hypothetical protein B0T14DRAFT_494157 [Immersiella caudata]
MHPLLLLLLTLLLSATPSTSQRHLAGDSFGAGAGAGPHNFAASLFDVSLGEADAQGIYPLPGPNTSTSYTAPDLPLEPILGWSLTVTTKEEINLPTGYGHGYTGAWISLSVPDAGNVHDSWQICVLEWRADVDEDGKYPERMREDDGSCGRVLSAECVKGVEEEAVRGYRVQNGHVACACPSLAGIGGCSEEARGVLRGGGGCVARTFNASQIREWPEGKFHVVRYGGPEREGGTRKDYDRIGSTAWPVLVMWGQSESANQTGEVARVTNSAKLACVRSVNATQNSKAGAPNPKAASTGPRNMPAVATSVLFASVLAALLLV